MGRIGLVGLVAWATALPALAATPVAWWRLDADGKTAGQTAGTVVDETGVNPGSGTNAPVYSADVFAPVLPKLGTPNGLSIDLERASTQYLVVPHQATISFGASAHTIEAWVKLETLGDPTDLNTRGYLVQKKGLAALMDDEQDYAFLVQLADRGSIATTGLGKTTGFTGHELAYGWGDGTNQFLVASSLTIDDTTSWHHVSVAYDGSDRLRFSVDGSFETISGLSSLGRTTNTGQLVIGGKTRGNGTIAEVYDGRIDELRIHSGFASKPELLRSVAVPLLPAPAWLALVAAIALAARRRAA
jgi:hypothetical protein